MFGRNPDRKNGIFPFGISWDFKGGVGKDNSEIIEKDEKYELVFNLAGFGEDEIDLKIDDENRLLIIEAESEEKEGHSLRSSTIRRGLRIPEDAVLSEEKVEASHNNGILSIEIPRMNDTGDDDGFTQIDIE